MTCHSRDVNASTITHLYLARFLAASLMIWIMCLANALCRDSRVSAWPHRHSQGRTFNTVRAECKQIFWSCHLQKSNQIRAARVPIIVVLGFGCFSWIILSSRHSYTTTNQTAQPMQLQPNRGITIPVTNQSDVNKGDHLRGSRSRNN